MSTTSTARLEASVEELDVAAYTIPTDAPEADGTLSWDSTTIVVVHAHGAGELADRLDDGRLDAHASRPRPAAVSAPVASA